MASFKLRPLYHQRRSTDSFRIRCLVGLRVRLLNEINTFKITQQVKATVSELVDVPSATNSVTHQRLAQALIFI